MLIHDMYIYIYTLCIYISKIDRHEDIHTYGIVSVHIHINIHIQMQIQIHIHTHVHIYAHRYA